MGLLRDGFTSKCYDGQNFFDANHYYNVNGAVTLVSNFQAGAGPAWYLLDTSHEIKPLIFQEREPYQLQSVVQDTDDYVFSKDEYLYGIRARVNGMRRLCPIELSYF